MISNSLTNINDLVGNVTKTSIYFTLIRGMPKCSYTKIFSDLEITVYNLYTKLNHVTQPTPPQMHIFVLQHKSLHSGQVCVKVSFTILILANFPLRGFFFLFFKAQFEKRSFGVSSPATRERFPTDFQKRTASRAHDARVHCVKEKYSD